MTVVIGVDPGRAGGVARLIDWHGVGESPSAESLVVEPMPDDLRRFRELIRTADHVFIEKCQSFPKQGIASAFNYGRHYGELLGCLIDVPHTQVPPRVWSRVMHAGCTAKWSPKRRSLEAARRLFPDESFLATPRCKTPHMGMLEASLIAEYGRRVLVGVKGGAA